MTLAAILVAIALIAIPLGLSRVLRAFLEALFLSRRR